MGKAMGLGLTAILATYAAAAVFTVAVLAIGGAAYVLGALYKTAKRGQLGKWPMILLALLGPAALMLLFGVISWNLEIAQRFTEGVHDLDGFIGALGLLVLYLGAYGFAVVMPTFGAFYAVWAITEENNPAVFYFVAVFAVAAGFFSGGIEHMTAEIDWSNGGDKSY